MSRHFLFLSVLILSILTISSFSNFAEAQTSVHPLPTLPVFDNENQNICFIYSQLNSVKTWMKENT